MNGEISGSWRVFGGCGRIDPPWVGVEGWQGFPGQNNFLEFGKEPRTDLEILDRFGELRELGFPILFASSRKSFIGRIFRRPAKELLVPSLATAAAGIAAGARLLRVHDVAESVQLAQMLGAIARATDLSPQRF